MANTIAAWSTQVFCRSAASMPLRQADNERDHQRVGRQPDRHRQPHADDLEHRVAEQQRGAEVAVEQIVVPMIQLRQQRLVEAEIVADLGDLIGRRGQPGDDRGGVAGDQVDHPEGDQADQDAGSGSPRRCG